jgi:hypothetical protein
MKDVKTEMKNVPANITKAVWKEMKNVPDIMKDVRTAKPVRWSRVDVRWKEWSTMDVLCKWEIPVTCRWVTDVVAAA